MTEISSYTLNPLWNDADFVRYRGLRETEPRHVLVVAPFSKRPAQGTIKSFLAAVGFPLAIIDIGMLGMTGLEV
jgi:hypothetical protein